MRLPPLPPETLGPELRQIHDGIVSLVSNAQQRITILDTYGGLIGPFPAYLHFPQFGLPAALFQRTLSTESRLPPRVREVVILTVGAHYGSRYELYAHELTGVEVGLSKTQVAMLAAGERPTDLEDEEALAHSFARCLLQCRSVPDSMYELACSRLGREGVGELAFLVGGYCLVSVLLNCFDVPVPGDFKELAD